MVIFYIVYDKKDVPYFTLKIHSLINNLGDFEYHENTNHNYTDIL